MFPLLPFLTALIVLFVPGFIAAIQWMRSPFTALACAPGISIFLYSAVGIVFSLLNIGVNASILLLTSLAISFVSFLIGIPLKDGVIFDTTQCRRDFALFGFCLLIGFIFSYYFYSHALDSWSFITQSEDNVRHYAYLRSLMNSSDWSTLHVSAYGIGIENNGPYTTTNGFYPLGWHIVSALTCLFSGANMGTGTNVVNLAFTGAVLPASTCLLLKTIFPKDRYRLISLGAFLSLSTYGSPWALLAVWPLFPNLASACLVPSAAALFILATKEETSNRPATLCLLIVECGGVTVTQPNGIFTCAVFLIPYFIVTAGNWTQHLLSHLENSHFRSTHFSMALISLFVSIIWTALYVLPPLRGVTSYYWSPISSIWQAIVDVILVAYPLQPAQLPLAAILAIGCAALVKHPKKRWLFGSYLLGALLFVVASGFGDNLAKHLFTGFWYTDPYRIAGALSLCSIPVAYLGSKTVAIRLSLLLEKCNSFKAHSFRSAIRCLQIALLLLFIVPSFEIRGWLSVITPFTQSTLNLNGFTRQGEGAILTEEKRAFLDKVYSITGPDALIANNPFDGSCFALSQDNLNLLYRNDASYTDDSNETWTRILRRGLCDIADSSLVATTAHDHSLQYVLLLGEPNDVMAAWYPQYKPSQWQGITAIDESTPGFNLILSEGNMCLYRIIA